MRRPPRAPVALLEAKNLIVAAGGKTILSRCSLSLPEGGIQVIMGPNGSGKSTLCGAIMGREGLTVSGTLCFAGENLLSLSPDERARRGLFLAFQHPLEIPGVSLLQMLRAAREARGEKSTIPELASRVRETLRTLNLTEEFMHRPLNEHASGGEKKRLEMAQLLLIGARLAILDEIDSGLDIDSLKTIAGAVRAAAREQGISFLVITHYERLLAHLEPDRIHVMMGGMIVRSGGRELASELERRGYVAVAASAS